MSHYEVQQRILAFAQHLSFDPRRAFETAREKAWLDHNGAPTKDGMMLVAELTRQRGTRTALRQLV